MADTVDVLGRIRYKQSGQEEDKVEGELTGRTVTHFLRNFIILSTNTTNTQIAFGASFTTAIYGVLKSHVGTFTYSRSTNTRHHLVNEGGFAFWVGDSSSLFVSNNSTTTPAQIEIVLAGS